MGTLPFSIGFSLILALLAWFSFSRMTQELSAATRSLGVVLNERALFAQKIHNASYETYINLTNEESDEDIEPDEGRVDPPKKRAKKTKKSTTSKLHIKAAFSKESSARQETELKLFNNLLKILYGSLPLFTNGSQSTQIIELFDELRATILSTEDKQHFTRVEHLIDAKLSGPNEHQRQFLLATLLKGANAEFILGRRCYVPKLINYVSALARKETCMSVYKAPREIILALFQDPAIVDEVLAYRADLHKKLTSKKATSSGEEVSPETLSNDFKTRFESKIPSGIDAQFIDFTVTKGSPIDAVERERHKLRKKD